MNRISLVLLILLAVVLAMGVLLGETSLSMAQLMQAFRDPASPPGEVLWAIRAPRAATAAVRARRRLSVDVARASASSSPRSAPSSSSSSSSPSSSSRALVVVALAHAPGHAQQGVCSDSVRQLLGERQSR